MYVLQIASDAVTAQFWYVPYYTSELAWDRGEFEPWRMLTSALLHSPTSAIHILFNMMALWVLGRVIEPSIGALRYVVLLVLSAWGGSVAVMYLADWNQPVVGASGAVFGLFGALFILMRAAGAQTSGVVALVGINMVISFMPQLNISWQGHLGGLVTGALIALAIAKVPRGPRRPLWQGLGIAGVAVVLCALSVLGIPLVTPQPTL